MLTLNVQAEDYTELVHRAAMALGLTWAPPTHGLVQTAAVPPATDAKAADAALKATEFAESVATNVKAEAAAEATKRTRGKAAAKEPESEKAQISTGEPREEPETKAEAGNGAAPALTHQDIRDLMGSYANTFGMKAVQTDGPVILSRIFGEGKVRASDIPDNPEALKKAFDALNKAIETNEFKRALAS